MTSEVKGGQGGCPDRHPSLLYIKRNNVAERRRLFERQSRMDGGIEEESEGNDVEDKSYKKSSHETSKNSINKSNRVRNTRATSVAVENRRDKVDGAFDKLHATKGHTPQRGSNPVLHRSGNHTLLSTQLPQCNSFETSKIDVTKVNDINSKTKTQMNTNMRSLISQHQASHPPLSSHIPSTTYHSVTVPRSRCIQGTITDTQSTPGACKSFEEPQAIKPLKPQRPSTLTKEAPKLPPKPPRMLSYPSHPTTITPPSPHSSSIYELLANTHSQVTNNQTSPHPTMHPLSLNSPSHAPESRNFKELNLYPPVFDTSNVCTPHLENELQHYFTIRCPPQRPHHRNYIQQHNQQHTHQQHNQQHTHQQHNQQYNHQHTQQQHNYQQPTQQHHQQHHPNIYSIAYRVEVSRDIKNDDNAFVTSEKDINNNKKTHNNTNNNVKNNININNNNNNYINNNNNNINKNNNNNINNNNNSTVKNKNGRIIMVDKHGYAVPNKLEHVAVYTDAYTPEERFLLKSKMSDAYSILRRPLSREGMAGSMEELTEGGAQDHLKRLEHVDHVLKNTMKKMEEASSSSEGRSSNNLIEYSLVVELNPEPKGPKGSSDTVDSAIGAYEPVIQFMWPEKLSEAEQLIRHFCFPDLQSLLSYVPLSEEVFSFFLTSACGDRKYCWCLRYSIPVPGQLALQHEAVCVVSRVGEVVLFEQLLQTFRQARAVGSDLCRELIKAATRLKLPRINKEVYLKAVAADGFKYTSVLKRVPETKHSTSRHGSLVRQLPMGLLVQVVASVLLERKVVLIADKISTLSACIMSICSLLYPFHWPHTLISALPTSLAEIIDSPSPYILGVLSATKSCLNDFHLDEVLVVNLDGGFFVRWVGDEASILPKKVQKALLLALSEAQQDSELGMIGLTDATISESFMRMFVETCGHYRGFIDDTTNPPVFKREDFVRAVSSGSVRLFLDWFSRTSIFQLFVAERAKRNRLYDVFEQRVDEYRSEMEAQNNNMAVKVAKDKLLQFFKSKLVQAYRKTYI